METTPTTQYEFNNTVHKSNSTQNNTTIFDAQTPSGTLTTTENQAPTICLNYNSPNLTNNLNVTNTTNIILAQNNKPEIINCKSLDPNSAAQCSALTHKFFVNISYDWRCHCYEPHISIGGEIEVDGKKNHNSLNQWGIWIKGGLSF